MPECYMLALAAGSSLDRHTSNVTLFSLVEQVSVQRERVPQSAVLPLEVHAYFILAPSEVERPFDVRFALVAKSGLETLTDVSSHKSSTPRYRTRTVGIPLPPVAGEYELRLDIRSANSESWQRSPARWPLILADAEAKEQKATLH